MNYEQLNYSKQTQFPQQQNEHNLLINKGLWTNNYEQWTNKNKPNQTQPVVSAVESTCSELVESDGEPVEPFRI